MFVFNRGQNILLLDVLIQFDLYPWLDKYLHIYISVLQSKLE